MFELRADAETRANVNRLAEFFDRLAGAGPGAGNVEKVAGAVRQGFQEVFETEGRAGGRVWAPLAARTVKQRRRLGFAGNHMILVRTGRYRTAFLQRGGDHVSEFSIHFGTWFWHEGGEDWRTRWHELGTTRMPARPVTTNLSRRSDERLASLFEHIFGELGKQHGGQ